MKPEFKVKVHHKGAEYSFNGGPKQKAEMFPAIAECWIPAEGKQLMRFKTGRKKWLLTVEREK